MLAIVDKTTASDRPASAPSRPEKVPTSKVQAFSRRHRLPRTPKAPWWLAVPASAFVGYLVLLPVGTVVYHAFTNWNPGLPSPFSGLTNFRDLGSSSEFRSILVNEAFMLIGLPLWTILPVVLAFALHERVPVPSVFRGIFFFPSMTSPALIGVLFGLLLSPLGPLSRVVAELHLGSFGQPWLANASLVKPVIICVIAWWVTGTGVVLFSAALATLPQNLLEQAEIDGAGWVTKLRRVVVPDLMPTLRLWVLLLLVIVLGNMFPWIFTLTRGGPGYSSSTLDYFIYNSAITLGQFGAAAAATVVLLLLLGAAVFIVYTGMVVWRNCQGAGP
jgi:ABC-type sugar transport system permease subunit